jgi:serine/threonine protein phosphatase PrpC
VAVEFAGVTDIGRQRETNEDSCVVAPLGGGAMLLAVADGMGGHQGGEVASRLAVQSLLDGLATPSARPWRERLLAGVLAAHELICDEAAAKETLLGMGTTLTAAVVDGRRLVWAHVGDSRAYLWRSGDLTQLTEDHSLVREMVREGRLGETEAMRHPQRNVLTRALGMPETPAVDCGELDLQAGDWLLLATDGLTGLVATQELAERLERGERPNDVARGLVDLANDRGGPDNITVVIARA